MTAWSGPCGVYCCLSRLNGGWHMQASVLVLAVRSWVHMLHFAFSWTSGKAIGTEPATQNLGCAGKQTAPCTGEPGQHAALQRRGQRQQRGTGQG